MRLDHVANGIANADHGTMCAAAMFGVADCVVDRVRPGDINRRYRSSKLVGSPSRRKFRQRPIECFLFLALDFFQLSPLMRINAGYDCVFYQSP